MKKALVPMIVSLALCGAATIALVAGNAHAQTMRKPVMVALVASPRALFGAAAPSEGGGPQGGPQGMHMPSPAEMATRHKQMCQDAYAHQVGDMAYLEAKLALTAAQQPLFEHWKSVKLDIAKRGAADCATRELPVRGSHAKETPLDSMAHEEEILKRRVADLDAERPVLGAFYNTLSDGQKMALMHPGEAMMGRHRDFAEALAPRMDRWGPGMGPGMNEDRQSMPDGPPPQ